MPPVATRYSRCTPVAPEAVAVRRAQVCQPPVLAAETVATRGPVGLSRRNCSVPFAVEPDASRVTSEVGGVAPKSTSA